MNLISLIVSIIGCITGVASLTIVLINNIFQVGKQKIQQIENGKSYYFCSDDTKTEGCCGLKYCGAVSLKITNCSSYPTTIDEIFLKKKDLKTQHSNEFSFDYIEFQIKENEFVYRDIEQKASLPIKFEPFETKYISAVFPFFEEFVESYGDEIKAKLVVVTPRKKYTIDVSIPEYHQLFSHYETLPYHKN